MSNRHPEQDDRGAPKRDVRSCQGGDAFALGSDQQSKSEPYGLVRGRSEVTRPLSQV